MTVRDRLAEFLAGRAAPVAAGIITALLVAFVWGGLDVPGVYHDERAYVVQARLLALFSWTAPAPPLPIFWEMPHLFVEPAIFAKYPPGHALLLTPGFWFGLPGLMPVLFAGIAGALTFIITRALAGGWVALAAWLLWTTVPETLDWHSSYFSQSSTVALWLLAVWALWRWREQERAGLLVLIVAAMGLVGITRPITGIALVVPIAVAVVYTAWQRQSLRGWKRSAAIGLLIIAIVPYWSVRTLGTVSPLPYSEYSRWYFPWDMPGFTRDTTPPTRAIPPDFERLAEATRRNYNGHVAAAMPGNFLKRSHRVLTGALGPVAGPLWVLGILGAVTLGAGVATFAAASFVLMLGVYLVMPHTPGWTIYYLELMPLVAVMTAVGIARATALAAQVGEGRGFARLTIRLLQSSGALLVLYVFATTIQGIPARSAFERARASRPLLARELIADLPNERAVVFVRRSGPMSPHFTVWDILGPPEATPTWIVRDLGDARNAELVALAEGRTPYLLDEIPMTLSEWKPRAEADATPVPE